ncbi:VOC family protein [Paraburkholderia sp. BL17N1]|uniref:VOC family protein n=1 Tax=Paraburkholderia sp. BL17N1 TaxID=1938798 RepID=UPI000EAFF8C7|nr:VOC family protein [Paraburkholderia sp. BL17N1]RKR36224.1 catechol 2,3-dioxygenase-like lactoylglutathione lyase family enzyme [Paraburkholderia sp. BL17N1]
MSQHELQSTARNASGSTVDMKLEVVVIPVSDVDRAKEFYIGLGWKLDVDITKGDRFRVVHFTPPGSHCSVLFGDGVTTDKPGSVQGLHLVVSDIEAARTALISRGVNVSAIFHDVGGVFHHAGEEGRASGPHPARTSYGSFAAFNDPDGNGWVFQEVTERLPGRVRDGTTFSSATDLASALRRAAAAHGTHEAVSGERDENWADWYADFIVHEQTGEPLPT